MLRLLTYRTQTTNDWNFKNLINTDYPMFLEKQVEDFKGIAVIFDGKDMPSKPPHIGRHHR